MTNTRPTPSVVADDEIARLFHEAYERLAPQFSYETRKASAVPWEQVPENNRKLMTAVAGEVRGILAASDRDVLVGRIERLSKLLEEAYEEGVEDGIGWHAYPESGPRPQWIDSVALMEMCKDAALVPLGGGV